MRQQHGLITRSQGLALGMSVAEMRRELSARRWDTVFPAVYRATGAPRTDEQRLLAACLTVDGPVAISHRAAAWMHGLDGPFGHMIELTVPVHSKDHPRGTIAHRSTDLRPDHIVRVRGVPVTSPYRTLVDLGAVVTPRVLNRALDDALSRRLVHHEGLLQVLASVARRGRRGVGPLRRSLAGRSDVDQTVFEAEFDRLLRQSDLPEFTPQWEVRDEAGNFVARVDFAIPELKFIIELDSASTRAKRESLQYDVDRQNKLLDLGMDIRRYTWSDTVGHPDRTLAAVARAVAKRKNELCLSGAV